MYRAVIRNNGTGEERTREYPNEDFTPDVDSLWRNGNFSCDCNREWQWLKARDPDLTFYDARNCRCGDHRFSLVRIELPDGRQIDDFTDTERG